jgi:hypothetical protein
METQICGFLLVTKKVGFNQNSPGSNIKIICAEPEFLNIQWRLKSRLFKEKISGDLLGNLALTLSTQLSFQNI